jgi:hypothetical protein
MSAKDDAAQHVGSEALLSLRLRAAAWGPPHHPPAGIFY